MRAGIVSNAEICIPLLHLLHHNGIPSSVFAAVEDPSQFMPVAHFCQTTGVPVQESKAPSELYGWLDQTRPDVVFVLGYRYLIDISLLPPGLTDRIFNIHFGALPSFKGPNPVFWQLKKGVEKITVTIHRINERFDDGPAVWVKEMPRQPHFNYGFTNSVCSQVVLEGIVYLLQQLRQQKTIPALPVVAGKGAYYKRPVLKDVLIEWDTMTAGEIICLINACNPWNRGAMTFFNGGEVKLLDAVIVQPALVTTGTVPPGSIVADGQQLLVRCCDGQVININTLIAWNFYIPGYQSREWGFTIGKRLGK
jgi:methionyl-tRNA formyltransferase